MIDYIIKNKEWIFSGIGVSVIAGLFFIFKHLWHTHKYKDKTSINITGAAIDSQLQVSNIQTPAGNPQAPVINSDIPQNNIYKIVQEVEDMPPLQRDDVRKHYIGLKVDWLTQYDSAYKKDNDLIRVSLTAITKCFRPIHVRCVVSLSDYKQFSILKEKAKVRITGTVLQFDSYSFELSNAKLYFQ